MYNVSDSKQNIYTMIYDQLEDGIWTQAVILIINTSIQTYQCNKDNRNTF